MSFRSPPPQPNSPEGEEEISIFSALELKVFKTFIKNYLETGELSEADAIALESVFGPMIQQVFEILEAEQVYIRESTDTGRVIVEVAMSGGFTYWIPPGHAFCQCMHFTHGSSYAASRDFCKHILAAHIYLTITPKEKYSAMEEEEFDKVLKQILQD